jgi:peptide/nickel transport system permease protein
MTQPVSISPAMGVARPAEGAASPAPKSRFWTFVRRLFREKRLGAIGAVVVVLFLFCGIFAEWIAPYGMNQISPLERLKAPSLDHPFGTDFLGRDMLSRTLFGAQLSVIIGLSAAALATLISILIGTFSAYYGGRRDMVTQRVVDAWMSFPDLIILIVIVSVFGPGMPQIIIALGLLMGITGSRIIRSAVLSVKENDYIRAAKSLGASTSRILIHHILPNILPPILILFTTRVGAAILAESGLSFLGLGVPPPAPTWGSMLSSSGRTYMFQAPWLAIVPGLCITVVVYAINMLGDALRDLLDPRMRGTR